MYIKGVERSFKYTLGAVMLGMSKVKIQCKSCNGMHGEGVKRSSKYTVRALKIFAHNFLNILNIVYVCSFDTFNIHRVTALSYFELISCLQHT